MGKRARADNAERNEQDLQAKRTRDRTAQIGNRDRTPGELDTSSNRKTEQERAAAVNEHRCDPVGHRLVAYRGNDQADDGEEPGHERRRKQIAYSDGAARRDG